MPLVPLYFTAIAPLVYTYIYIYIYITNLIHEFLSPRDQKSELYFATLFLNLIKVREMMFELL